MIALDRSQSEGVDNAEDCFLTALSTALAQNAKWWELRIATSLARVWRGQGRARESRELLDPVYGWFTESFDTTDLCEAKGFLDDLS